MENFLTVLKQLSKYLLRFSVQHIQLLLAILFIIILVGSLWTTAFADDSIYSNKNEFIPIAIHTQKEADYSSDPYVSFKAVSLDIVADILDDGSTSDDQVKDRLESFFDKLQAPIPSVKPISASQPQNPDGKQVSASPPVGDESESNDGEEVDKDNEDDEENPSSTPETEENDQPDVLDPNVDITPGDSGDTPGQTNETPDNSGDTPEVSSNISWDNDDEEPLNKGCIDRLVLLKMFDKK